MSNQTDMYFKYKIQPGIECTKVPLQQQREETVKLITFILILC